MISFATFITNNLDKGMKSQEMYDMYKNDVLCNEDGYEKYIDRMKMLLDLQAETNDTTNKIVYVQMIYMYLNSNNFLFRDKNFCDVIYYKSKFLIKYTDFSKKEQVIKEIECIIEKIDTVTNLLALCN